MIRSLSPESVANAVRFSRAGRPHAAALILEGATDLKLYRNIVDRTSCEMYAVNGKDKVLRTLANLQATRTPGILTIVDADCDHLANTVITNPNVITTDTRDIEGLLILMPALEKVLNEHNLPEEIGGGAIRDLLLAATRTLGYVRWLALQRGWSLDFKSLVFSTFIDGFTVRCDDVRLAAELINRNPGFAVTGTQIIQDGLRLANTTHNPWQVSRGHDLTKVLAYSASVRSGSTITSSAIESQLRLAMESGHFAATSFCIAICRWQANNRPFVILRAVFCSGSNQTAGAVGSPPQNTARV